MLEGKIEIIIHGKSECKENALVALLENSSNQEITKALQQVSDKRLVRLASSVHGRLCCIFIPSSMDGLLVWKIVDDENNPLLWR